MKLSGVMGLLAVLAFSFSALASVDQSRAVSTQEAQSLLERHRANPDFVVIDFRSPLEFTQGHIEGAINVEFLSEEFAAKMNRLSRDKTYLLYFGSKEQAEQALPVVKNLGFENVVRMQGGFRKWIAEKRPVVVGNI